MKIQLLFITIFLVFFLIYAGIAYLKKKKKLPENNDFSRILMTAFPSSVQEITKFGIIRILFGVFLLQRAFFEWYYIPPMDLDSKTYLVTLSLTTLFSVTILVGFFTNFSLLIMTLFYFGEKQLRAGTLGNDVAAILAVMLVCCLSYKSNSVDGWIEKKKSKKWEVYTGNFLFNLPSSDRELQFAQAKFLAVLSYWCLCLYSCFKHYATPGWMNGDAAIHLMTSSYLNEHYGIFREIFKSNAVVEFFKYSMFLMFPWYLIFLPAFFIKGIIRFVVVVWWILFIILSHFFLNLSALGMFEFILIAGIVMPAFRRKNGVVTFFYDGKCNLCERTVKFFRFFDVTRRVKFVTLQSGKDELESHGVSQELASTQLAGLYQGKIFIGYKLYTLLTRLLPMLWPLYPLFLLGTIFSIGPRIYKKLAANRIKLFGACALPERRMLSPLPIAAKGFSRLVNLAGFGTISFLAILFLSNPPIYGEGAGASSKYRDVIRPLYYVGNLVGIAPIDVFNYKDLNMSRNWRVIHSCDPNFENCDMVPMTGFDGERLSIHNSDTLYFGGTLRWRRGNLEEKKLCDYGSSTFSSTKYIDQILQVYMRKNKMETGSFTIDYYNNPLPDLSQKDWATTWWKPENNCQVRITIDRNQDKIEIVEKNIYE